MNKIKHNKKRNVYFLFEALIRFILKGILKEDKDSCLKAKKILLKNFKNGSLLKQEKDIYESFIKFSSDNEEDRRKVLEECKSLYRSMDRNQLFLEQSRLLEDINKELTKDVYSEYVPNYKLIASLNQVFNNKVMPNVRVILENNIIRDNFNIEENKENNCDKFTFKVFINKFNEVYSTKLLKEQKMLIAYYIRSTKENSTELKSFIYDEMERLEETLHGSFKKQEIECDDDLKIGLKKVVEIFNEIKTKPMDDKLLLDILKIQSLAAELES